MPDITPEPIQQYASDHTSEPGPLFAELAAVTRERMTSHGMMSGNIVGRLLQTLIHALGARRVLEIGTFTGYSAMMMAEALPADGRIITCDVDPEATGIAKEFWARSPHGRKIDLRLGPALETLKRLEGPFDFVFIDADKEPYPEYYRRSIDLLAPMGVIAVDNVLWGGRIMNPEAESGLAIARFNDIVQNDPRVVNVLLPVRDGVMLIWRK